MNHRVQIVAWVLMGLLGSACKSSPAKEMARVEAAPISVETHEVKAIEVPTTLRLTGTLRGDRETDLAANAQGRVISTSVERGQEVKANEVLAKLDVRAAALTAAEARAQVESARTQVEQAKRECERYEQLRQKGAVSEIEYDRVMAQCRTLPHSVEAASARASLAAHNVGDGIIRAPFPGLVSERYIEVGQYVRQETRVVTLVSIDTLRLEFAVPEAEIAHAKVGAKVVFKVAAFPGKIFEGTVRFVSGALRPATRDLVVEALVDNKERLLKPGMFANVELVTGSRSLPAVPRASVRQEGGTARAFFVANGRVEERLLTLGPDAGDLVSVVRGAAVGDRVAVGKLDELSNGRAVQ